MSDHDVQTMQPAPIHSVATPVRVGPLVIRFLVERASTRGGLAMFEFDVPRGAKVPAGHSHDAYDETVYALRGRLTWTVDGERFELAPGECAVIPRGAVHRFDNLGEEMATTLAVVTPGLLGPEYFLELAAVIAVASGGPPAGPGGGGRCDAAARADAGVVGASTPRPRRLGLQCARRP